MLKSQINAFLVEYNVLIRTNDQNLTEQIEQEC